MKNISKIIALSILSLSLHASEPSAYGAGDLNSPSPYGLTPEEKALLETKKNLKKVEVLANTQNSKVNSLTERIDGLQTIIEGLVQKTHENKVQLSNLTDTNGEYTKRIETLVTQNSEKLQELQTELESLKKELEEKYVTRAEFDVLVAGFKEFRSLVSSELKRMRGESGHSLRKTSKAQIFKDAQRLYKKQYYTKAIEKYKYLLTHNYKPATSSFKLGEMYYYRKDYATAIAYYKESAKRYSKASYMPTLMLHTAISMYKTGDKKNAHKFFQAVIAKYPSSKEAKIAKKYL